MDISVSALALLALSPVLLAVAIAIRRDSRGAVLYRQARRGLNGAPFQVYKFRSMRHDPDAAFAQALRGDARVTRVGAFIRRTSLDELPQLLNVLSGDMSLIGPRPHPIALDDQFAAEVPDLHKRYAVKPGISGLAQVSGHRGETPDARSMQARLDHDLRYIAQWSPMLDVTILRRTLTEVLRNDLAY